VQPTAIAPGLATPANTTSRGSRIPVATSSNGRRANPLSNASASSNSNNTPIRVRGGALGTGINRDLQAEIQNPRRIRNTRRHLDSVYRDI